MKRYLSFDLSSYWQIGSGSGRGAVSDSVVLRDACGLPTIPGRAIKGLVRDALELLAEAGHVTGERVADWLGTPLPGFSKPEEEERVLEESRFRTNEGKLWFGSARLGRDWQNWAGSLPDPSADEAIQMLYSYVSSTAIDKDGVAAESTLRVAEVTVPLKLRSEIRGPEDGAWVDALKLALPLVRSLGKRRNRGYGRVQIKLEEK